MIKTIRKAIFRIAEARSGVSPAIALRTDSALTFLREAEQREKLGDLSGAASRYRDITAMNCPGAQKAKAYRRLAAIDIERGDKSAALISIRQLRKFSQDIGDHRKLFLALKESGRQAVIDRYIRVVRRSPALAWNESRLPTLFRRYLRVLPRSKISRSAWLRSAAVFWSEEYVDELIAISHAHPSGQGAAIEILRKFYMTSFRNSEFNRAATALSAIYTLMRSDRTVSALLGDAPTHDPSGLEAISFAQSIVAAYRDGSSFADTQTIKTPAAANQQISEPEKALRVRDPLGYLRQRRKSVELWPSEYRWLFRLMRESGRGTVLERYVAYISKTQVSAENFMRTLLVVWAADRPSILKAFLDRTPNALDEDMFKLCCRCLQFSVKNHETENADCILRKLLLVRDLGPKKTLQISSIAARGDHLDMTMTLIDKVLSRDPQSQEAHDVRQLAAESELYRLVRRLSPSNAQDVGVRFARIEPFLGNIPLARHLSIAVSAATQADLRGSDWEGENRDQLDVEGQTRLARAIQDLRDATEPQSLISATDNQTDQLDAEARTRLAKAIQGLRDMPEAQSLVTTKGIGKDQLGVEALTRLAKAIQDLRDATEPQSSFADEPNGTSLPLWSKSVTSFSTSRNTSTRVPTPNSRNEWSFTEAMTASPVTSAFSQDMQDRLKAIHKITPRMSNPRMRKRALEMFEDAIVSLRVGADENEVGQLERDLCKIALESSGFLDLLAQHFVSTDRPETALDLVADALRVDGIESARWLSWAELALRLQDPTKLVAFCYRSAQQGSSVEAQKASEFLLQNGMADQSIEVWSSVTKESELKAGAGRVRALKTAGRDRQLIDDCVEILRSHRPYSGLDLDDQRHVIALIRTLTAAAFRQRAYAQLKTLASELTTDGNAQIDLWADAMIAFAGLDKAKAICLLEKALTAPTMHPGRLDVACEIASVHLKYNHLGDAREALKRSEPSAREVGSRYANRIRFVEKVDALCGEQDYYPECLIDIVLEELAEAPALYEPVSGHIATIVAGLSHGGGERQAITIVQALTKHHEVSNQTLLVRSIKDADGFFLPLAKALPIEVIVYGDEWRTQTDIERLRPLLGDRPRLFAALELLPYSIREEIVRLVPPLLKARPSAVHIRQDLYAPAIAAAIIGAPVSLVHRGSLSRNNWAHTPLEAEAFVRPICHAYRKLLEKRSFFVVNNTEVGRATDIDWIKWPDTTRYKVVNNAVDFEGLGEARESRSDLRQRLGIPPKSFVMGGVFRFSAVKRPILWVEIAALVVEAIPTARFAIAGDGKLMEVARRRAASLGIEDRFHLPGAVTNVGEWYQTMDLLLLTSSREGLPNVLIEAQHFGVPVVSSDVGGARETMDLGVTGHLVESCASANAFAEIVVQAVSDCEWFANASRVGPDFVHRKFGIERATAKLLEIYRSPIVA